MRDLLTRLVLLLDGQLRLVGARVGGGARWSFAAGGWAVLVGGAVLALVIAVVCYRRTTEGLTLRSRLMLAGLRAVSLGVLLVMVSGAVVAVDLSRDELP